MEQQEKIHEKCIRDLETKRVAVENLKSLSIIQNTNKTVVEGDSNTDASVVVVAAPKTESVPET